MKQPTLEEIWLSRILQLLEVEDAHFPYCVADADALIAMLHERRSTGWVKHAEAVAERMKANEVEAALVRKQVHEDALAKMSTIMKLKSSGGIF